MQKQRGLNHVKFRTFVCLFLNNLTTQSLLKVVPALCVCVSAYVCDVKIKDKYKQNVRICRIDRLRLIWEQ